MPTILINPKGSKKAFEIETPEKKQITIEYESDAAAIAAARSHILKLMEAAPHGTEQKKRRAD